jgi:hypothetical protein
MKPEARRSATLLLLATLLSPSCSWSSKPENPPATELQVLKFTNDLFDQESSCEYTGFTADQYPAFDAVQLYDVGHGESEKATSFMLQGSRVQARPTVVWADASWKGQSQSRVFRAAPGHFIAWVETDTIENELHGIAFQEDGVGLAGAPR